MTWSAVQGDWSGFMAEVSQMLPFSDLHDALVPATDFEGFCRTLARVADMTPAEAEELVVMLILPAWHSRRMTLAAA